MTEEHLQKIHSQPKLYIHTSAKEKLAEILDLNNYFFASLEVRSHYNNSVYCCTMLSQQVALLPS